MLARGSTRSASAADHQPQRPARARRHSRDDGLRSSRHGELRLPLYAEDDARNASASTTAARNNNTRRDERHNNSGDAREERAAVRARRGG
jgi:hypothetical protein